MKCFSAHSPPFGWVDDSREGVRHDVKIRRDFQPVEFDIIAGVDDDGQHGRVGNPVKAEKQSRSANTSAERRDFMAREFLAFDQRHETHAEMARTNLTQAARCLAAPPSTEKGLPRRAGPFWRPFPRPA